MSSLGTDCRVLGLGCHCTALFKSFLGTHLPLSYWPCQVTKLAQIQGVKEEYTSFNGGNDEVILQKAMYREGKNA